MNVKGILIEGTDGREYLLGFGQRPTGQTKGPTLSRRQPDGTFQPLEHTREASKVAREHLGLAGRQLLNSIRGSARTNAAAISDPCRSPAPKTNMRTPAAWIAARAGGR